MSVNKTTSQKKQGGASLIEILISLLMISLGIMGLVTTQMNTMTNNREAYFRTQATVLAYDIIDRLRANREEAIAGSYVVELGDNSGTSCETNCSPVQIAQADIFDWKSSLADKLPGGDGAVSEIINVDNSYTVNVQWQQNDGETTSLDVSMRL